ncbi:uncharacterized protein BcabD6B2_57420 [Babesia caballi]|uniref:Uncharacterized protein n=1 Tax=Babesia caballi TaxID=5871 RepID=A0AAV4M2K3_BABCB|nr:hypothetical protein BcabD6B2_57420 [Babesia caballi]
MNLSVGNHQVQTLADHQQQPVDAVAATRFLQNQTAVFDQQPAQARLRGVHAVLRQDFRRHEADRGVGRAQYRTHVFRQRKRDLRRERVQRYPAEEVEDKRGALVQRRVLRHRVQRLVALRAVHRHRPHRHQYRVELARQLGVVAQRDLLVQQRVRRRQVDVAPREVVQHRGKEQRRRVAHRPVAVPHVPQARAERRPRVDVVRPPQLLAPEEGAQDVERVYPDVRRRERALPRLAGRRLPAAQLQQRAHHQRQQNRLVPVALRLEDGREGPRDGLRPPVRIAQHHEHLVPLLVAHRVALEQVQQHEERHVRPRVLDRRVPHAVQCDGAAYRLRQYPLQHRTHRRAKLENALPAQHRERPQVAVVRHRALGRGEQLHLEALEPASTEAAVQVVFVHRRRAIKVVRLALRDQVPPAIDLVVSGFSVVQVGFASHVLQNVVRNSFGVGVECVHNSGEPRRVDHLRVAAHGYRVHVVRYQRQQPRRAGGSLRLVDVHVHVQAPTDHLQLPQQGRRGLVYHVSERAATPVSPERLSQHRRWHHEQYLHDQLLLPRRHVEKRHVERRDYPLREQPPQLRHRDALLREHLEGHVQQLQRRRVFEVARARVDRRHHYLQHQPHVRAVPGDHAPRVVAALTGFAFRPQHEPRVVEPDHSDPLPQNLLQQPRLRRHDGQHPADEGLDRRHEVLPEGRQRGLHAVVECVQHQLHLQPVHGLLRLGRARHRLQHVQTQVALNVREPVPHLLQRYVEQPHLRVVPQRPRVKPELPRRVVYYHPLQPLPLDHRLHELHAVQPPGVPEAYALGEVEGRLQPHYPFHRARSRPGAHLTHEFPNVPRKISARLHQIRPRRVQRLLLRLRQALVEVALGEARGEPQHFEDVVLVDLAEYVLERVGERARAQLKLLLRNVLRRREPSVCRTRHLQLPGMQHRDDRRVRQTLQRQHPRFDPTRNLTPTSPAHPLGRLVHLRQQFREEHRGAALDRRHAQRAKEVGNEKRLHAQYLLGSHVPQQVLQRQVPQLQVAAEGHRRRLHQPLRVTHDDRVLFLIRQREAELHQLHPRAHRQVGYPPDLARPEGEDELRQLQQALVQHVAVERVLRDEGHHKLDALERRVVDIDAQARVRGRFEYAVAPAQRFHHEARRTLVNSRARMRRFQLRLPIQLVTTHTALRICFGVDAVQERKHAPHYRQAPQAGQRQQQIGKLLRSGEITPPQSVFIGRQTRALVALELSSHPIVRSKEPADGFFEPRRCVRVVHGVQQPDRRRSALAEHVPIRGSTAHNAHNCPQRAVQLLPFLLVPPQQRPTRPPVEEEQVQRLQRRYPALVVADRIAGRHDARPLRCPVRLEPHLGHHAHAGPKCVVAHQLQQLVAVCQGVQVRDPSVQRFLLLGRSAPP